MRTPLIAGNWKMNTTVDEGLKLIDDLIKSTKDCNNIDILVCPPYMSLYPVSQKLKGSKIKIGAQNMHYENKGAYTGEISPVMLNGAGVEYVIIGHSERRQYFSETDESINMKLKSAIIHGIKPILCVGETLEQREKELQEITVEKQIVNALLGIDSNEVEKVVIAYEPVWAIGTGRTATSNQANEMATFIRNTVQKLYSEEEAQKVVILYGGSVKGENASEIMKKSDIDGALVGGASLKSDEFTDIIKNAMN